MKCLCASTRRAARLLTQQYEQALRPANLTAAQFELLGELSHRPGITQTELAELLVLSQTTLSRNLSLLLSREWVQRQANPKDRRQTTYELTPRGKQAWSDALPLWHATHDRMRDLLGPAWMPTWSILELLNKVVA